MAEDPLTATGLVSYEESVRRLRAEPGSGPIVRDSYLDEDNLAAAQRFEQSEEWAETARLLRLDPRQPVEVLDLGCGNGIASYALARAGQHVVAVDPDPSDDVGLGATARLADAAEPGSLRTVRAFAERLPFPDGRFARVYARQALHHLSDLRDGLAECARILAPGGRFLAAREHVVTDDDELERFLQEHPLHEHHGGEHAYPVQEYEEALRAAGLHVLRTFGPFETPVNTFPTTDEQIDGWLEDSLARRAGRPPARLLARVPLLRRAYRRRLSRLCRYPGRLYSFLCVRPEASSR